MVGLDHLRLEELGERRPIKELVVPKLNICAINKKLKGIEMAINVVQLKNLRDRALVSHLAPLIDKFIWIKVLVIDTYCYNNLVFNSLFNDFII